MNIINRRKDNGKIIIRIDPNLFRPAEVHSLLGNPEKAYKKLGWKPTYNIEQLVDEMIREDKFNMN